MARNWRVEQTDGKTCGSGTARLGRFPCRSSARSTRYHARTLSPGHPYVEANTRQRDRLSALVARLDEEKLRSAVNEHWTVAGVLGHIAFWDGRVLALAGKLERGEPFSPSDAEPEDVDWINDAARPLIHAIEPHVLADLALRLAEETDRKVASLPTERMWPHDPESPINALRATHRGEHLDQIEAAIRARGEPGTT